MNIFGVMNELFTVAMRPPRSCERIQGFMNELKKMEIEFDFFYFI